MRIIVRSWCKLTISSFPSGSVHPWGNFDEGFKYEGRARKELEALGCPLAYPAFVLYPFERPQNAPVVEYWESVNFNDRDLCLWMQLKHWRAFLRTLSRRERTRP